MKNIYIIIFLLLSHHAKSQTEYAYNNGFLVKVIETSKLYENQKYFFIPDSSLNNTLFTNGLIFKPEYYIGEFIWLANWQFLDSLSENKLESSFQKNIFRSNSKIKKVNSNEIKYGRYALYTFKLDTN